MAGTPCLGLFLNSELGFHYSCDLFPSQLQPSVHPAINPAPPIILAPLEEGMPVPSH